MKLSTRTRYGVRALLELAGNTGTEPLQLKLIGDRQDISVKYLEQLMVVLKSAGLVQSVRGAKGGYVLARPAEKIILNEVFSALEGPVSTTECVSNEKYCSRVSDCVIRGLWIRVEEAINSVLGSTNLKQLADQAKQKNAPDYQI